MELTVANDFQNGLDQATINSILSYLVDRSSGIEYEVKRDEINHVVSEIRSVFIKAGFQHVKARKTERKHVKVNPGSMITVF